MLNVCFGDSECGMLKDALDGEKVTYSHRALELGQIYPEYFEESRREWIDSFFAVCSKCKRAKIWKDDCKRFERILDDAKKDKELRIWHASSPHARCGLYHLVYSLQGTDCRIFVVEMPSDVGYREPHCDRSWGEASPTEARYCLKLERELTADERNELSLTWERLAEENSELRLNVDGKVTSLPIWYLDEEILSYAPKDKNFSLGRLVGETLGNCVHAVSDGFIAERIESMIDGGELTVVERAKKREDYYSKTVIRVSTEEDKKERERKFNFVMDFLQGLGIDMFAIGGAIEDKNLENSYRLIMANPKMTKKQALKKLKLKEYEPNPVPHKYRDYGDKR